MAIRDHIPKGVRFAKLTVDAILDQRLSSTDIRILAYLLSRTENWKVITKQVAGALNINERTVRRSIERLQEAGYAWRRVEKIAGLIRYPDIIVSATPMVRTGKSSSIGEAFADDPGGEPGAPNCQICPDERSLLTEMTDKSVHETTDMDDRLTQSEFFTQNESTQSHLTHAEKIESGLICDGVKVPAPRSGTNWAGFNSDMQKLAEDARQTQRLKGKNECEPQLNLASIRSLGGL